MKRRKIVTATVLLSVMASLLAMVSLCRCNPLMRSNDESIAFSERYAYGSPKLDLFIMDSYNEIGENNIQEFYQWMEQAYGKWRDQAVAEGSFSFSEAKTLDLKGFCRWAAAFLRNSASQHDRESEEMRISAEIHRMIKGIIPRFSLERGYEFTNVVRTGERQCFLQSVIIAGLLQSMDIEAGLVMVYVNERGQESNNGHAVVLERLADGKMLIVDASEKKPFATHRGLFVRTLQGYRYVLPCYAKNSESIEAFNVPRSTILLNRRDVKAMDTAFIQSQFDVYRGEWVPGAFHDSSRSAAGMEAAARYFERGVSECPENPLSLYFLGRSYEELGRSQEARDVFVRAHGLYARYGWIPESMRERSVRYQF